MKYFILVFCVFGFSQAKAETTDVSSKTVNVIYQQFQTLQHSINETLERIEELYQEMSEQKKKYNQLHRQFEARLRLLEKSAQNANNPQHPTAQSTTQTGDAFAGAETVTTETATSTESAIAKEFAEAQHQAKLETLYESAFELLLQRKYTQAIVDFEDFLEKYPASAQAPLVAYWLAEAYYVQNELNTALNRFELVVEKYPDTLKYPDSLLKKGLILLELGRIEEGKKMLNQVIYLFPDSTVSALAQNRLTKVSSE